MSSKSSTNILHLKNENHRTPVGKVSLKDKLVKAMHEEGIYTSPANKKEARKFVAKKLFMPRSGAVVDKNFIDVSSYCPGTMGEKLTLTHHVEAGSDEFCCLYAALLAARYRLYNKAFKAANNNEDVLETLQEISHVEGSTVKWMEENPRLAAEIIWDWVTTHPEQERVLKTKGRIMFTSLTVGSYVHTYGVERDRVVVSTHKARPNQDMAWYVGTLFHIRSFVTDRKWDNSSDEYKAKQKKRFLERY